ncbi:MAG: DUF1499 domain-containing protein [Symploca sp. SIO3E6]|nr:DUF1499 domain-containing protein [Caldora sp. SIO3E6]
MQYLAFVPYLITFSGIGLSYAGMLPAMVGWAMSALGVLFGLGLAVIVIFVGQSGLLWTAVFAVLPSVIAIPMVINDLRYPRINDVATDVENPPIFVAALQATPNVVRDMTFPEKNKPIIREAYPNVRPLILDERLDQVFQCVETLVKIQPGWVITRRDAKTHTLEGEVTTSFFRFVDDFVIHVSEQEDKALINMRSKSRDGLVDAGANAKRIQRFFEQLENFKETGPHVEG